MSSTRTYTPLQAVDDSTGIGVRITDWEDYEAHINEFEGRSITPLTFEQQERDGDSYPRTYTEYVYLKGFAGYPGDHTHVDSTTIFKLENFGFEYSRDRFIEFWQRVASYCEPFEFYHSPANHFPSLADLLRGGHPDYAYYIRGEDGSIKVEQVEFTQTRQTPTEDDDAWWE